MPRARQGRATRERVTVSLAKGTAKFLRKHCHEIAAPSLSACVETLVATYRRKLEQEDLDTQTRAYFDSLSESERREEAAWAELATGARADFEFEAE